MVKFARKVPLNAPFKDFVGWSFVETFSLLRAYRFPLADENPVEPNPGPNVKTDADIEGKFDGLTVNVSEAHKIMQSG
jgi:hypothetical protein